MVNDTILHFSFHKCITMYYGAVMSKVFGKRYEHFDSLKGDFLGKVHSLRAASVNNVRIDLDRFGNARVSQFVRDPRDLLVSGYFYHRDKGESWTYIDDPTRNDWRVVNGAVPDLLPLGKSLTRHLNECSKERGLLTELQFRRHHFETMRKIPKEDERLLLVRYEDLISNEVRSFWQLFRHYGLNLPAKLKGALFSHLYSATSWYRRLKLNSGHIRNPASGKWEKHFTKPVKEKFKSEYNDLLLKYGYETDCNW